MLRSRADASNAAQWLAIALIILALHLARGVFIPLAFALLFSFLLTPLVRAFERLHTGRILAVALAVLLALSVLGGIAAIIADQMLDVVNELPRYRLNIHEKIAHLPSPRNGPIGRAISNITEIGKELSAVPKNAAPAAPANAPAATPGGRKPTPVQVVEPPKDGLKYLHDLVIPALQPLAMAGLAVVFTIFILVKREDLRNRVLRLAGIGQLNVMTQAMDDGAARLSRYLLMQLGVNTTFGFLFGLGLFFIGVPNAPLWGFIAGLFRFVPYVGTMCAAAIPVLLALAVFNSWVPMLAVFLLFAALELVTANFVEPWLYGANTGISALALLMSLVFWSLLWGWPGLILATPLTVCLILVGRYVPAFSFLHILLGDQVALAPDAQFVQRLLAMDQAEARLIAERFLKQGSLVELYDTVILPALSLAEQHRHKGELDDTREEFIFLSTNELIAELADSETAAPAPAEEAGRVFCLAANDRADETAAAMLAQVLEHAGLNATVVPHAGWEESLRRAAPKPLDVLCISALPPFAFADARAMFLRIRELYPEARTVAGIWGLSAEPGSVLARFGKSKPDRLVARLSEALQAIEEWRRPPGNGSPGAREDATVSA